MAHGRPLLDGNRNSEGHCSKTWPPTGADYIPDWTRLTPGENVCLFEGDVRRCGRVDAVTDDGQGDC